MRNIALLGLMIALACAALARAQDVPEHVPQNEARAGKPLELHFRTDAPDRLGAVTVHVLADARHPRALALPVQRTAADYVALIPADRVAPPALRYYVTQQREGEPPHDVFASASAPHRVRVVLRPDEEVEQTRLRARLGKRSVISLQAEAVSFGAHKPAPSSEELADRYYGLEAGYHYAVLTRVEEVALSLIHVRAEAGEQLSTPEPHAELTHPGIDAGRATITWRLAEPLRVRTALLLGASQRGFEYGGSMDVIVGDPHDVSLELGGLAIRTLGETAHLRLGFRATPRIPMGATIEVTSFPTSNDPGVRLSYDVGYRFDPTTEISLRAGYQGRSSIAGGPSLGLNVQYGF